jgi:hypothetical protein
MTVEQRGMLVRGNTHLGPDIFNFSLPAPGTCPGATEACLSKCYALRFARYAASCLEKHAANFARAQDPIPFARAMLAEIRFKRVKLLRIHVAGDFFDVPYVEAWDHIACRSRGTKFLFYTRSWRLPEMRPAPIRMASRPNVFAWWSEDRDTGPSDMPVGRRCFFCATAEDESLVPPGVLVFREVTKAVRKWVNGSWVCPKEQGTRAGITCSSCERCFDRSPLPFEPRDRGRGGSAFGPKVPKESSA